MPYLPLTPGSWDASALMKSVKVFCDTPAQLMPAWDEHRSAICTAITAQATVICWGLEPPLLSSLLLRKPWQAFSRMLELAKPALVEVVEHALAMFCLFCMRQHRSGALLLCWLALLSDNEGADHGAGGHARNGHCLSIAGKALQSQSLAMSMQIGACCRRGSSVGWQPCPLEAAITSRHSDSRPSSICLMANA